MRPSLRRSPDAGIRPRSRRASELSPRSESHWTKVLYTSMREFSILTCRRRKPMKMTKLLPRKNLESFLDTLGIFFGKTIAAENSTQTQTKKPKILTKKDPNMKQSIKLKTTTLLVIPLVLACFALLPRAQAATPELLPAPAPDGFYNGFNTAAGFGALFALTTGTFNTALGFKALRADTSGGSNTAVGGQALLNNNTGSFNTAVGENALDFNTVSSFNMALGQGALASNLTGNSNTAMGFQALNRNTTKNNTAVGYQALFSNTTGSNLNAVGYQALV